MGAYGTKINGESSTDIEALVDGGAMKELKKQIESKLTQINSKMKKLEDNYKQIGTEKDSRKFRTEIASSLSETSRDIREISKIIN